MTNMSNTSMTLADFERLLDVYGGDRTLWPADARAAAAQLVSRDADARRLLAEAVALDRLLDRAPLPALATEASLADRIVAAAQRSPRIVTIAGARPAGAPARIGGAPPHAPPADAEKLRRFTRADVRAAGVLAAALVVGVVIGFSNLPQRVLPTFADITGASPDRYGLALADVFDEDVL
jgi:hypothetical protein